MNKLGAMTAIFNHIIFDICFCVVETQSCNTPGLFLLLYSHPQESGSIFFLINLWENKANIRSEFFSFPLFGISLPTESTHSHLHPKSCLCLLNLGAR